MQQENLVDLLSTDNDDVFLPQSIPHPFRSISLIHQTMQTILEDLERQQTIADPEMTI